MQPKETISAKYVALVHSFHYSFFFFFRNLCAKEWASTHPQGLQKDFDLFWENLKAHNPDELQVRKVALISVFFLILSSFSQRFLNMEKVCVFITCVGEF